MGGIDLHAGEGCREVLSGAAGQWTGQARVLQDGLSPAHGFSSKHSRGHTTVMSAAFRRVEFSNHWLGEDLELGAMGWARGPETQN